MCLICWETIGTEFYLGSDESLVDKKRSPNKKIKESPLLVQI